jgi:hypothetical protein
MVANDCGCADGSQPADDRRLSCVATVGVAHEVSIVSRLCPYRGEECDS